MHLLPSQTDLVETPDPRPIHERPGSSRERCEPNLRN